MADWIGVDVFDRTCSVAGCDRKHAAKGYCGPHYARTLQTGGDPQPEIPLKKVPPKGRVCSVGGCGRPHMCRGYCEAHYNRWKRYGDASPDTPVEDRNSRKGTCKVEGCDKPIRRRLLCNTHGLREQKYGDVMAHVPIREYLGGLCSVPGCGRENNSFGWCDFHYQPFRRYRLAPDDYDAMLAMQGGGCAICGRAADGATRLFVDHDHACCPARSSTCGKCVRGLLCNSCNSLLGKTDDSIEWLERAIDYLRTWQSGTLPGMPQVPAKRRPPARRAA